MSFDAFGELAQVSGAAMHKACSTGRIDEVTADRLVAGLREVHPDLKADLVDLLYGGPKERPVTEADLDRATLAQIFGNLPAEHRETWISIGHLMVQRYGPTGAGKPFAVATERLPKRKARV